MRIVHRHFVLLPSSILKNIVLDKRNIKGMQTGAAHSPYKTASVCQLNLEKVLKELNEHPKKTYGGKPYFVDSLKGRAVSITVTETLKALEKSNGRIVIVSKVSNLAKAGPLDSLFLAVTGKPGAGALTELSGIIKNDSDTQQMAAYKAESTPEFTDGSNLLLKLTPDAFAKLAVKILTKYEISIDRVSIFVKKRMGTSGGGKVLGRAEWYTDCPINPPVIYTINMGTGDGNTIQTLLHEISHVICMEKFGSVVEGHGPEWAGIYLELCEKYSKNFNASKARNAFSRYGVRSA